MAQQLAQAVEAHLTPRLNLAVHVRTMPDGALCLHINVPQGADPPYALDGGRFFVREGATSRPATRDEIVALARRGYQKAQPVNPSSGPPQRHAQTAHQVRRPPQQKAVPASARATPSPQPTQAIAGRSEEKSTVVITAPAAPVANGAANLPVRRGLACRCWPWRSAMAAYFTVRDLRNNTIIRNVTMKSARDLWHYAITQFAEHPYGPEDVAWRVNRAVLAGEERAGKRRYDLAIRDAHGRVSVFYGVTTDGLDEEWQALIAEFEAQRARPEGQDAPATA